MKHTKTHSQSERSEQVRPEVAAGLPGATSARHKYLCKTGIATERFAARMGWTHYAAGTSSEILSILPECAVIAFLVPVSPLTAFIVALVGLLLVLLVTYGSTPG
ncbi:MAG: hypothetical protein ACI9UT_003204 [Flavobacteriales bacterium]